MNAIFLDRDGVICENRTDHVKCWEEFIFIPGAITSLAALSELDLPLIVITNQAVIGRGMVPSSVVEDIHRRMVAEIAAGGGRIDRVVYCPHRPEDHCACRKPEPGMLLQVAQEMGIDLARSYVVGDAADDLLAGQRVGCRLFLVLTGRGWAQLVPALRAVQSFAVARSLREAAIRILATEAGSPHEALAAARAMGPAGFPADCRAVPKSTTGGQI